MAISYYPDTLIYNHTNDSIILFPKLIALRDTFYIRGSSGFTLSKVDYSPFYFGYWDQVYDIIGYCLIKKIGEFRNSRETWRFLVSVIIGKDGKLGDVSVEK